MSMNVYSAHGGAVEERRELEQATATGRSGLRSGLRSLWMVLDLPKKKPRCFYFFIKPKRPLSKTQNNKKMILSKNQDMAKHFVGLLFGSLVNLVVASFKVS